MIFPIQTFRCCLVIALSLLLPLVVLTATDREADVKVGFSKGEDRIITHEFLKNGDQVLIIGGKYLKLYEVRSGKQIYSVEHSIPQFAPGRFISRVLLLGLPQILRWRSYVVDPNGKWIITLERIGERKIRSAVVRNIEDARQIAIMEFPEVAVDHIAYDEQKNEVLTLGTTGIKTIIARWDTSGFSLRSSVSVNEYKWHQFIAGGEKILIGSGDTRFNLAFMKEGETLSLYDVRKGESEKNYTADGLKPRTSFTETVVSSDEKYLVSRRDDRYFLWEIVGTGTPLFEIVPPDPMERFSLVAMIGGRFAIFRNGKNLVGFDPGGDGKPLFLLASDNPNDTVELLSVSENGEVIVVGDDTSISVLRTMERGKPLFIIERDSLSERFYPVTFVQDQQLVAIGRNNRKESKEFRTELYDLSGKLVRTVNAMILSSSKISPDLKFVYSGFTGSSSVWNIEENKGFSVPLKTSTSSTTDSEGVTSYGDTSNTEHTDISSDFSQLLKYGEDLTVVYDVETGKEVAVLLDKEHVKYDKRKKIKKSGLAEAGWVPNSNTIFAYTKGNRSLGFWQIRN